MTSDTESDDEEPGVLYTAEDIRIRQYGETAVVAFRLLGTVQDPSESFSLKKFYCGLCSVYRFYH